MILQPCGTTLFVAHQRDDVIAPLTLNPSTGRAHRWRLAAATGSPVCIAFPPRT